jgi:hypothetical protein
MSIAAITRLSPLGKILSALNFDVCGFSGVIIVVLNTNFKLVSFFTLSSTMDKTQVVKLQTSVVERQYWITTV